MMGVDDLYVALEWFGRIESSLRALLNVQATEQVALEYAERITRDDLETFASKAPSASWTGCDASAPARRSRGWSSLSTGGECRCSG